jgi:hypothetical protein
MDTFIEAIMRGCLYLTRLDISKNRIQKSNVSILSRLLQGSGTLTYLNISGTTIPPESFSDLLRAISNNPYLSEMSVIADEVRDTIDRKNSQSPNQISDTPLPPLE